MANSAKSAPFSRTAMRASASSSLLTCGVMRKDGEGMVMWVEGRVGE